MPAFRWRILSSSGVTPRGILLETAPYQLLMLEVEAVLTVVVEVVDMEAIEVPEISWLLLMLEAVCKVHFSMTVYPAEIGRAHV